MRILFFLTILSVLFGPFVYAQPPETFITSFDPNPDNMFQVDKGKAIWSMDHFVYVINGFVKEEGGRKDQIFKIDANTRQIVKVIEFEGPQGDIVITANAITSDNYILLTGEWLDYSAGFTMRMFLAKLTPDLETVWIQYYPDLMITFLYSEGVAETEAGDYLIYLAEGYGPPPHDHSELRVIKTDTSGTILFNKVLTDTFNVTYGHADLTPSADGNFYVSSKVQDYYVDPLNGTLTVNSILHKIDPDANQLWTKTLGFVKYDIQAPICTSLSGGGGAVMWTNDTLTVDPDIPYQFVLMQGFDPEGNPSWKHEWSQWGFRTVNCILEAGNGDILGVGHYEREGWPNRGKGWFFRTNSTGELLWERFYSDSLIRPWSPLMEVLDICEMDDGRIAGTGYVLDTNSVQGSFNFNVVLLVLDSMGCQVPGCAGANQYIVSVSEPLFRLPELPVLSVFPNPSSGAFSVTLPQALAARNRPRELRCYDQSGRLLGQYDWPLSSDPFHAEDIPGADGPCYLLLFERHRPVASGKIIIQR